MKNRIILIFLGLIYTVVLRFAYIEVTHANYEYQGYAYREPEIIILIISYSVTLLPLLWMPISLTLVSQLIYWMVYLLVYVPANFVPYYSIAAADRSVQVAMSLCLLLSLMIIEVMYKLKVKYTFKRHPLQKKVLLSYLIFFAVIGYSILMITVGFKLQVPSLEDVYSVREDLVSATEDKNWINYIIPWLSNAINPYFIAVGMIEVKIHFVLTGLLLQILIYSFSGYKSVLFSSFFIIGIYFLLKKNSSKFGILLTLSLNVLVIFSWQLDKLINMPIISSIIINRLIMTPGILTGWYFDFFSSASNPLVLYSNSFLQSFITYPYNQNYSFIIMENYAGVSGNANANMWADGFANLGYIGVLITSIFLGLVMRLIDVVTTYDKFKNKLFSTLMLVLPSTNIINTSLTTALWTHGLLIVILIIYFLPSETLQSDFEIDDIYKNS